MTSVVDSRAKRGKFSTIKNMQNMKKCGNITCDHYGHFGRVDRNNIAQ